MAENRVATTPSEIERSWTEWASNTFHVRLSALVITTILLLGIGAITFAAMAQRERRDPSLDAGISSLQWQIGLPLGVHIIANISVLALASGKSGQLNGSIGLCNGPQNLDHLIVCSSASVGAENKRSHDGQEATEFFGQFPPWIIDRPAESLKFPS